MRDSIRICVCVIASFGLVACNNGTSGGGDAGAPVDAAMPGDAADGGAADGGAGSDGGADAGSADAGPCGACGADHACLRDVCVPTCGSDTTALDMALGASLSVVAAYCRTPDAFAFVGSHVYEVTHAGSGTMHTFTLARWNADGTTPAPTTLGTATYTAPDAATMVFTGGYLAVSPDESHAIFGYTTAGTVMVGGLFDLATASGMAVATDAPGNFDVAFLDATHFAVNGGGLGMMGAQGLYLGVAGAMGGTQVATHLGEYSGSLGVWADQHLVLAGGTSFGAPWADGMTGDRVVVLDQAALLAASTPIDAATLPQLSIPSAFAMLSGGRLAHTRWGATAIEAIEVRTLTRATDGTVNVSSPATLSTGALFTSAAAAGTDVALVFDHGILVVH
jgi:hypothetical protein